MLDSSGERAQDRSYVAELAQLLCHDERQLIAMLHAYCDESYDGDIKRTPVYVVAGFIGEAHQWQLFEKLWHQSMCDLQIETIGCHAAKCANGATPYKGMSGERRAEIQWRLIVDIAAAKLFGIVSIIDMSAYRHYRDALSDSLSAVRQCAQHMCLVTESATTEPIAFVFDRNDAFGKRARVWYEIGARNPNPNNRHYKRLGAYAEDDRMRATGLQAADLLAYAGFRYASGRPGWQWSKLTEGIKMRVLPPTGHHFWSTLAQRLKASGSGEQNEETTERI